MDVSHAGEPRFDLLDIFPEEIRRNVCLDPKHQLQPLLLGLDRLGRELRDVGDKAGLGGNHELGCGIEHETNLGSDRHASRLRGRQEEGHVDVAEIDEVENPAAGGQHLAGLRDAVLHAAIARRFQRAVVDVGGDTFNGGLGRSDGCSGIDDQCLGGADRSFRRRELSLGRRDGGLCPLDVGPIIVENLLGNGTGLYQLL